jgi:hypothetical protein
VKKTFVLTLCLLCLFAAFFILPSCTKNKDSMPIQQGDSLIEINAIYPQNNWLQVRYNNVINAAIDLTIAFYLNDGSRQNVSLTIPAGYKSLQNFGAPGGYDYLNVWDYHSGTDSVTGVSNGPLIYWNAAVDSIQIVKVTCSDRRYGFKVLTGADTWHYYHPTDAQTVVSFIANGDTVLYSDYDFQASTTWFNTGSSRYSFDFFSYRFFMVSAPSTYPFQQGATLPIPLMYYYWNGVNKGSQPDGPEEGTNGSTLSLTITKLTGKTYDATFSGKIWSSRQPDTLVFTNGIILNALLPVKQ